MTIVNLPWKKKDLKKSTVFLLVISLNIAIPMDCVMPKQEKSEEE